MWGQRGTGDGEFDRPSGIALDSDGNVYVADSGNNRIQKFTSTGVFLDKWGEEGNGEGQFTNPQRIAVDSRNNIYVSEYIAFWRGLTMPRIRIQKFTPTGDFFKQWGEFGFGDSQFDSPKGIAVQSSDYILVIDSENHRIQKFTSDGDFITKWGRYEFGDGWHLGTAIDIAVDSNDNNYVTDVWHHLVKKFEVLVISLNNGDIMVPEMVNLINQMGLQHFLEILC